MADETLKIDANNKNVSGAVTDDSNLFIKMLRIDDTTKGLKVSVVGGGGLGTVTSVSVVSANGFAGTVATATTTPAITLSTTVTGLLKGNGTSVTAAINSDLPVMTATVGGAVPTPPNNTTTFLRGDGTFAAPAGGGITIGTTTITSGNNTRILYNNSGVVGEYTLTGTGTVVAMQTSPVFLTSIQTPTIELGAATDTTISRAGAGLIAVEGVTVVDVSTSQTLTNKTLGGFTMTDGTNVILNTTTGSKIGTATNQKLGFFNSTPIVQPTGDVITALQNLGLGASLTVAATTITSRTLWGQTYDGSGNVSGSLTAVGNITGGASSMTITAGTGNSRTLALQSTTSGGTATTFLTGNADQTVTFASGFTAAGASSIGTGNAFTTGTIELGAASDTTLSRVSAGVIAVEGVNVVLTTVATLSSLSSVNGQTISSAASFTGTVNAATGYQIGGAAATGKILRGNGTNFVASTATFPDTSGTSGNVLTSDGTNFVSSAPAGGSIGTPALATMFSTAFETAARFTATTTSSGSTSLGTSGLNLTTGASSGSFAKYRLQMFGNGGNSDSLWIGSPVFSVGIMFDAFSVAGSGTIGAFIGNVTFGGGTITLTNRHIGFKIVAVSGTFSVFGTQADGTTENATSALTTMTTGDYIELLCKVNATSSVDYYWRKNTATWSAATNLTTNMPSGAIDSNLVWGVMNTTANTIAPSFAFTSYSR